METGRFVWHDLASEDVERAADFYAAAFGWQCRTAQANGGVYLRLSVGGRDVASLYRIGERARERGMRAHWTPYVAVRSIDAAAAQTVSAGGTVLVRPFEVVEPGACVVARIAMIADPDGAIFGLWEAAPPAD